MWHDRQKTHTVRTKKFLSLVIKKITKFDIFEVFTETVSIFLPHPWETVNNVSIHQHSSTAAFYQKKKICTFVYLELWEIFSFPFSLDDKKGKKKWNLSHDDRASVNVWINALLDFPANIKINLNTFRNARYLYVNNFNADKPDDIQRGKIKMSEIKFTSEISWESNLWHLMH